MKLLLDFETKSEADLSKVGADRYAEDPSTEILTLSWTWDFGAAENDPQSWAPFLGDDRLTTLYRDIQELQPTIEAHHLRFELAIWREVMVKRHGAPPIAHLKRSCTMARCAYKALPVKLEMAAEELRLEQRKDMTGHKAMKALARGHVYKDPVMQFERTQQTYEYCVQDIRVEEELGRVVGDLTPEEQRLFELDMRINDRGVCLDVGTVAFGAAMADEYVARETERFRKLTGLNPSQRDQVLAWCRKLGAPIENLQQAHVDAWIDDRRMPSTVRNALLVRRQATRAAAKKYAAMLRCVCADGRAHGVLQYHAATTGRWGGRLFQPQNFKRPSDGDADLGDLAAVIAMGQLQLLEALYGDPIVALSDAARAMIVAERGALLSAGDLASIETHVLMWLAGEEEACKFLDNGKQKLYVPMAESIYRRKIDKKKDLKEYTVGKIAILQLGYQAGWRGFQESVKTQGGVSLSDEECQEVVTVYREKQYPRVPALWRGLETAMFEAVAKRGKEFGFGPITYRCPVGSRWLECILPSGRTIHYFSPEIVSRQMPWDDRDGNPVWRDGVQYRALKEGRMRKVHTYGGHNTENVVQAIARDFLVHGMFNAEKAGLPVVLTVHDEVVTEHPASYTDPARTLEQCMTDMPAWGRGCPMGASCWTNERYIK